MLGTVRLILALMVALSHVGWYPGLNPGVVAVVVFYMIAGYAMAALWQTLSARHAAPIRVYLQERLLRIWPPYLAALVITLVVVWIRAPQSHFLSQPSLEGLLQNILLVPLGFYMFSGIDRFTLIPPAWSLAVEIQFYLLLPFLVFRWPKTVCAASLIVVIAAQMGWLPREWFTYRLLPGVLHLFCLGVLLFQAARKQRHWQTAAGLLVLYGLLIGGLLLYQGDLFAWRDPGLGADFSFLPEWSLGVLIGIPVLAALAPLRPHRLRSLVSRRLFIMDHAVGQLAYGIFLIHFAVYWWLVDSEGHFQLSAFLIGTLLMAALLAFLVERPVNRWRRRLISGEGSNKTEDGRNRSEQ